MSSLNRMGLPPFLPEVISFTKFVLCKKEIENKKKIFKFKSLVSLLAEEGECLLWNGN